MELESTEDPRFDRDIYFDAGEHRFDCACEICDEPTYQEVKAQSDADRLERFEKYSQNTKEAK